LTFPARRWTLAAPVSPRDLDRFSGFPPLIVQLLHNRNIRDPGAAHKFVQQGGTAHNPFQLKGMDAAVARLRTAISRQESIAVYGDFDADGVTATTLLVEVLRALGAQVLPYIPHRVDEGYGLNLEALRHLYRQGVRLVVTVDCGVRSVEEVRQASRGLDLIITDHHTPGAELPPAVAVVNPRQPGCPYPYRDLAGVGLAFKLAQALLRTESQMERTDLPPEELLLDLVALGTVSDVAPLLDENRALVQRGLAALNASARPGIEALMAAAGLRRGEVDATAIGFRLGPRLNAAGRLDTAMTAYELLTSRDLLHTQHLARQLDGLNQRRQELTEEMLALAEARILEAPEAHLYLVADQEFRPGIVGLVASRLTEAHYRPSAVVELGQHESRGSCRSIPEFDITQALDQCADLLIRYGGHAAAAGFTVATHNLEALRLRLQAIAAERLAGVELRPRLDLDVEVPLEDVSWATHALLQQMEPCGAGNPQPVLFSRSVQVREVRSMGSDGQHLKLMLRDGRGIAWDAVFFRQGRRGEQVPGRIDVAYTLEAREWNGKRLQLNIQDLRAAANA
jgi:single-stranded-DNA-specific exonuclease